MAFSTICCRAASGRRSVTFVSVPGSDRFKGPQCWKSRGASPRYAKLKSDPHTSGYRPVFSWTRSVNRDPVAMKLCCPDSVYLPWMS